MKEYWYLRNGDLRPEIVDKDHAAGYANMRIALEQLAESGNLFDSEACAAQASKEIRRLLKKSSFRPCQECSQQTGKHSDNNLQPSPASRPQSRTEENQSRIGELQLPTQQNASHQQDDNSQANALRIHLEVHIHS